MKLSRLKELRPDIWEEAKRQTLKHRGVAHWEYALKFNWEVGALFNWADSDQNHAVWSNVCKGMFYLYDQWVKESQMNKEKKSSSVQIDEKPLLCHGLNDSAMIIYQNNKEKGFWDKDRNIGELLMLVTSELGEAMEAHRKGKYADARGFYETLKNSRIINGDTTYKGDITPEMAYEAHFKKYMKDTFEDEIADAVIRLLDMCAGLGIDLEKHINAKVKYNQTRPRLHGKNY